jgi:hypothetical protein
MTEDRTDLIELDRFAETVLPEMVKALDRAYAERGELTEGEVDQVLREAFHSAFAALLLPALADSVSARFALAAPEVLALMLDEYEMFRKRGDTFGAEIGGPR